MHARRENNASVALGPLTRIEGHWRVWQDKVQYRVFLVDSVAAVGCNGVGPVHIFTANCLNTDRNTVPFAIALWALSLGY